LARNATTKTENAISISDSQLFVKLKGGFKMHKLFISIMLLTIMLFVAACADQDSIIIFTDTSYMEAGDNPDTKNCMLPEMVSWQEAYETIINAYRELELSSFTVFDEYILGHSFYAEYARFGFPPYSFEPSITYAFHDINGDGLPELFIGAGNLITGIYILQNGKPVSVIQQISWRFHLNLLTDYDGNYIIELSRGRMSQAEDVFFTLNESGELITLDRLYTRGHIAGHNEFYGYDYLIAFLRYRYVDGELGSIR